MLLGLLMETSLWGVSGTCWWGPSEVKKRGCLFTRQAKSNPRRLVPPYAFRTSTPRIPCTTQPLALPLMEFWELKSKRLKKAACRKCGGKCTPGGASSYGTAFRESPREEYPTSSQKKPRVLPRHGHTYRPRSFRRRRSYVDGAPLPVVRNDWWRVRLLPSALATARKAGPAHALMTLEREGY